jgi:hypothetical protein
MTDFQFATLMGTVIKLATMGAGTTICVLGVRLFIQGVAKGGASAEARGLGFALRVDRGGPGLVFGLFGCIVLLAGILKGVDAQTTEKGPPLTAREPIEQVPAAPPSSSPAASAAMLEKTVRLSASIDPTPPPPPRPDRPAPSASGFYPQPAPPSSFGSIETRRSAQDI